MKKIILSKEFIFRFIAVVLFIEGITCENYRFLWLLSSGIVLGIYYGWYNDLIWRPTGKLYPLFPYRAHQLWIHIICGIVGSTSLYFLLGVININDQAGTLAKLGLREFILFVVALLAYVGLLPRIIWFFSYAQSIFSKS
ncbi:hypothetical protein A3C59_03835 [Candidatus Daviesbacteria bacterium RIFCSPHIGHO2_02_FULL_36_13]|uniref:Uncharacterized protein n=1 Tax=Candidatus Daviesbacteria bacterium RIFCSPHIGHO2_02_FULL_36_13 TaxID=1797768 RepID=A0A1F5JUT0_9BACT|nr:MAG: hypothetical protein A3C59_03835 [Candidatus Daviesbacteria bacterium RIFCSPHIGHO2_02_FULL_36_13]